MPSPMLALAWALTLKTLGAIQMDFQSPWGVTCAGGFSDAIERQIVALMGRVTGERSVLQSFRSHYSQGEAVPSVTPADQQVHFAICEFNMSTNCSEVDEEEEPMELKRIR